MNSYIDYLDSLSKKQLMVMLARQRHEETQGIAVIGLGCRLAGGINDAESFWTALRAGHTVSTEWPDGPLDSLGRPRWDLQANDLSPMAPLLRKGAYLREPDLFDAAYFQISDEEAMSMDPQQRLLLEVSMQAVADANLTRADFAGRRVGVFMALGAIDYPWLWTRSGRGFAQMNGHLGTGNVASAAAGRIGLSFGINGPAMSIDTSSSSVLVALHSATLALRRRDCDFALIGGCQLLISPFTNGVLSKGGMLSESGRCRPFSAEADGYARAEGCGVLVLRRLADADAAGDQVYAVVRGSAVYQHGARSSLPVASATGQKIVVELALKAAQVEAHDVPYVEAQANGSRVGGIVEAEALVEAYARNSPAAPPLYLGSCKANIGYMETASGAPALIKAALALAHAEIPPQIGHEVPDPDIAWARCNLRLAGEALAWPASSGQTSSGRLMGVSGFGLTGIAAHAVLGSVAPTSTPEPLDGAGTPALLVVSGHSAAALAATAERLHHYLEQHQSLSYLAICRTLAEGRDPLKFRSAAVVRDRAELLEHLRRAASPELHERVEEVRPIPLELAGLPPHDLRAAFELCHEPGFGALAQRLAARCEKLEIAATTLASAALERQPRFAFAWVLAWLDWLSALNLPIGAATLHGDARSILCEVISGRLDVDAASARLLQPMPPSTRPPQIPGWEVREQEQAWAVRRTKQAVGSSLNLQKLRAVDFLRLLAQQFEAGADLKFKALSVGSRRGLCRLPAPALLKKSYWPTSVV